MITACDTGGRAKRGGLPLLLRHLLLGALVPMLTGCFGSSNTLEAPAHLAPSQIPKRGDLTLTPMTALNSPRDDFGATMPLDSTLLLFTSGRIGAIGKHSIFWSRRSGGAWSAPAMADELNNTMSNGMPTIMPEGQTMYFAGCDYGFGDCDIYRVVSGIRGAVRVDAVPWTVPRNMGVETNGIYWDSQPTVSSDGSLLIFSSDRPGGLGGRDLWVSLREQDGTWGRPINAGGAINTPFDEVTPWIAPDCRTLYFASNGHPVLDGFDIFAVELECNGMIRVVSTVENLGVPINSEQDDIALSLSADGSRAFLSSNRRGGQGGYDIYELSAPPRAVAPLGIVRGTVRDMRDNPVLADIDVVDLHNGNVIGRFQTSAESGEYALVLRAGSYAISAQAPAHLFDTKHLVVPMDMPADRDYRIAHELQGMRGWVRLLVFFEIGSSLLERESSIDLDRTVDFLLANPTLRIEIGGHTDNVGGVDAKLSLSLERAEAVKAYLVGNEIGPERIVVKGYGATAPIADNTTEEGRALNRRVEMRIVE